MGPGVYPSKRHAGLRSEGKLYPKYDVVNKDTNKIASHKTLLIYLA